MGRRKIEIQPIHEERNRTVTFIKRKAGLFKKAHELAVLCQVDVAVIILGSNNTFYEFSSVDVDELLKYYHRSDLAHDVKEPKDFGDYIKKQKILLSDRRKKRNRDDDVNVSQESDKRIKTEIPPQTHTSQSGSTASLSFNNPLQQQVQEQFQSLYAAQANPDKEEPPQRPVLRVQIPNNTSYGNVIGSESSTPTSQHNATSANPPALVSHTTSSVRYEGTPTADHMAVVSSSSSSQAQQQPQQLQQLQQLQQQPEQTQQPQQQSVQTQQQQQRLQNPQQLSQRQSSQRPLALHQQLQQQQETKGRLFTGYELPPVFTGSPAFTPYLGSPLQGPSNAGSGGIIGGNMGGSNGGGQHGRLRTMVKTATGSGSAVLPMASETMGTIGNTTGNGNNRMGNTGPVPAEYAHDLMVPSPAISSMFPDWRTNLPSAAPGPTSQSQNDAPSVSYNGSTGLTPYIMVNNTPLGNRFFNFDKPNNERRER